jgi:hypothetical protein
MNWPRRLASITAGILVSWSRCAIFWGVVANGVRGLLGRIW